MLLKVLRGEAELACAWADTCNQKGTFPRTVAVRLKRFKSAALNFRFHERLGVRSRLELLTTKGTSAVAVRVRTISTQSTDSLIFPLSPHLTQLRFFFFFSTVYIGCCCTVLLFCNIDGAAKNKSRMRNNGFGVKGLREKSARVVKPRSENAVGWFCFAASNQTMKR